MPREEADVTEVVAHPGSRNYYVPIRMMVVVVVVVCESLEAVRGSVLAGGKRAKKKGPTRR